MQYLFTLLSILAFFLNVKAQYVATTQDTDDLNYTFQNFQTAVLTGNAQKAASYMDNESLEYLKGTLYAIQHCDSTTLIEKDFTTIFSVQFARFIAPDGKLSSLKNEYDFLGFMIENSLKQELSDQFVVDIKVDNDIAIVYTKRDENSKLGEYYFVKKGDDWKYNSTINNQKNEEVFKREDVIEAYGGTKRKIIDKIAEQKGWNQMGRDLWQILP